MWSFKRQVNYYETDRMGVVHHSNYLRYLEEARYVWMEEMGLPYPEFEKQGVIIPCTTADTVHYTTTREDYKPTSIKRSHPELFEKVMGLVSDTKGK